MACSLQLWFPTFKFKSLCNSLIKLNGERGAKRKIIAGLPGRIIFFFLFFFVVDNQSSISDPSMNSWTQRTTVGQLWFWSNPSPVWVQCDLCEGGFAAVRLLHLIPGLHYTSGPVKQCTDEGTSPSLQRRRAILYCLMRRWGNIITSAESSKVKPECSSECPNISVWQS